MDPQYDGGDDDCVLELLSDTAKWEPITSCEHHPRGRCSHSLTSIGNSCALLFGGGYSSTGAFTHLNDLWLFNGITSEWKLLETQNAPPPPRRGHVAEYINDKLILFGGVGDGQKDDEEEEEMLLLNDLWVLDLTTLCWERCEPFLEVEGHPEVIWPSPRRGSFSFVSHDQFYILGGETISNESMELEIFCWNFQTKTWKRCHVVSRQVEGCPYPAMRHLFQQVTTHKMMFAPSLFLDSTLVIFGGLVSNNVDADVGIANGSFNGINRFLYKFHLKDDGISFEQIFDFRSDTPNDLASRPLARYFHGGCTIGNRLLICGGVGPDGNESDTYLYHSGKWTLVSSENGPGPRNGLSLAALNSNHIILFGGGVYPDQYFGDTFVLTFGTAKITEVDCNRPTKLAVDSPQEKGWTVVELLISSDNGKDQSFTEQTHVERLSSQSEYFHRMFQGPFQESNQKQIQISGVDPQAAKVCLAYMRTHQLRDLELEKLDSVVVLADMWGMHAFMLVLEDFVYNSAQGDDGMDELEVLEYAKLRCLPRLVRKCLKRLKWKYGSLVPQEYRQRRNLDPVLLQEVTEYLENSLL